MNASQGMDASIGWWVQILCGPRPPENWPRRSAPLTRPPYEVSEATIREVASCSPSKFSGPWAFRAFQATDCFCQTSAPRVQAKPHQRLLFPRAIAALGEDSIHAKGLHEAPRIARARSALPPVAERVESCKKFLDRARQRVVRAQDVIDKATAQKKIHDEEVAEGERRLVHLQAEAS